MGEYTGNNIRGDSEMRNKIQTQCQGSGRLQHMQNCVAFYILSLPRHRLANTQKQSAEGREKKNLKKKNKKP